MEGWGTFAPISVSFDIDREDPSYKDYDGPALDLANVKARHQGDDYDFADDAVYLVNLDDGRARGRSISAPATSTTR